MHAGRHQYIMPYNNSKEPPTNTPLVNGVIYNLQNKHEVDNHRVTDHAP